MDYIKIKSIGEIDIEAFTIIGNSTKKDNEKQIGFFGSGLKYSISGMLRNNIQFKVFKGLNEIEFSVKEKLFRNTLLNIICINNKETSFTTELGASDWDKPFAPIREIYSNALDEDKNTLLEKTDIPLGEKGFTTFFIEMNETVKDFYNNKEKYFCTQNKDVLFSNKYGSVYRSFNNDLRLFRKGILIEHNDLKITNFNYNSDYFIINESRTNADHYRSKWTTWKIWRLCEDENLITELLRTMSGGNSGVYEHTLYYQQYSGSEYPTYSEQWKNVVLSKKYVSVEHLLFLEDQDYKNRVVLPLELLESFKSEFPEIDILGLSENNDEKYILIEPNILLSNKVLDAINILKKTNYKYRYEKLDIKFVKFLEDNVLGKAKTETGNILLSEKIVDLDVGQVTKIIIEENEHLKTKFEDCTRDFQNHLFNLYYEELLRHE